MGAGKLLPFILVVVRHSIVLCASSKISPFGPKAAIYKRSFFILLAVFAAPIVGFASTGAVAIADWEIEALRKIHGERMVECVKYLKNDMFAIDARSDEGSIVRVREIRLEARLELESGRLTGPAREILRGRLDRALKADLLRATDQEKKLSRGDEYLSLSMTEETGLGEGGSSEDGRIACAFSSAAIPGSGCGERGRERNPTASLRPPRVFAKNINLRDYSLKSAMVDYWRLYLYRWDDLPWPYGEKTTSPLLKRAPARAYVSIIPNTFNKISHNTKSPGMAVLPPGLVGRPIKYSTDRKRQAPEYTNKGRTRTSIHAPFTTPPREVKV